MISTRHDSKRKTRYALLSAALLFLVSPVWAQDVLGGLMLLLGLLFRVSALLIAMVLPGALIGANLAFSPGRRMRCILGALAANVPVIAAYALWGGNWDDREWAGFFFQLFVLLLPIVAVLVGVPVGLGTYRVRSFIHERKGKTGDAGG